LQPTEHTSSRSGAGTRRRRKLAAAFASAVVAALATTASIASIASAETTLPIAPIKILVHGNTGNGDFFVSPFGDATTYANGAEIVDPSGNVVWFHQVPAPEEAADFRVQTYEGQPVLTFWQGVGAGGHGSGVDYIYNDNYQQIAEVKAGNGQSADVHEFEITPQGTALIPAYYETTADLTSIGGPSNQKVLNEVVQEIDIKTGQVLFEWNPEQHIPFSQSEQPLPASATTAWDWFHMNAIKPQPDGSLLVDARDTWTFYDVNHTTGNVNWQIGGKASTFTQLAAPGQSLNNADNLFAWQHDPESIGNDEFTIFDDESAGIANTGIEAVANLNVSRLERFKVDPWAGTVTLEQTWNQPDGLVASSQGNAQTTADDNLVTSWGNLPYYSEFDQSGDLLYNAEFPTGINTYRAYQFPWPPTSTGGGNPGGGGNGGNPGDGGNPGGGDHHHRRHHHRKHHHHQQHSSGSHGHGSHLDYSRKAHH
jgi:Arylsulfotransferase (ASST)